MSEGQRPCHWEGKATSIGYVQKPLTALRPLQLHYCRLHLRNSFSADPLTLLIIQEVTWLATTIFLWLLLHVNSPKSASLETEKKKLPVSSLGVHVLWSGQWALWVELRVAIVYPVRWKNTTSRLRIYLLAISNNWLIADKIITHNHGQCWGACVRTAEPKFLCLM